LLRTFWAEYVSAYLRGGNEEVIGDARSVFTNGVLRSLQYVLSPEALSVPVLFTEQLSNRLFALCIGLRDRTQIIAINARFKVDPEVMAHTMAEEFVHAQQRIEGVDFEAQRRQFAYHERPYEQEAKQVATEILGYEPAEYENYLLREEPADLIDR
jgi:hypothetical protein